MASGLFLRLRAAQTLPLLQNYLCAGARRYSGQDAPESSVNVHDIDIFAAAVSGPAESSSFPTWYKQMRGKLAVGAGPVYLGKTAPFPYNPEFRPQRPLTDEFKSRVVALWDSNPSQWTPRQLAIRFKISIERVKAIIKLKLLQRKMEAEGFKVDKEYVSRMESHLDATGPTVPEASLIDEYNVTKNMPPKLMAVPEESKMTAEEAARLLGRKLRPIHRLLNEEISGDVPYMVESSEAQENPAKCADLHIRNDPYETSRWKFVFVDTGRDVPPADRQVLVREPNGDLRRANPRERLAATKSVGGDGHSKST